MKPEVGRCDRKGLGWCCKKRTTSIQFNMNERLLKIKRKKKKNNTKKSKKKKKTLGNRKENVFAFSTGMVLLGSEHWRLMSSFPRQQGQQGCMHPSPSLVDGCQLEHT